MKIFKKLISIILSALMIAACFSVTAFADVKKLNVNVSVNGVKLKDFDVTSDKFTVTFNMDMPELIVDGQGTFEIDDCVKISSWEFPVVDPSVIDNVNKYLFNFSSVKRPYDFSGGKVLVAADFKVVDFSSETANINLIMEELDSKSTVYIGNTKMAEGFSVTDAFSVTVNEPSKNSDADNSLKLTVDEASLKTQTFSVSMFLTVPELLVDGEFLVVYDSSKLKLKDMVYPIIGEKVADNLNYSDNEVYFNFSNVKSPYDFTGGGELLKMYFEAKPGFSSTDLEVLIKNLDSMSTDYVDNSVVKEAGLPVMNSSYLRLNDPVQPVEGATAYTEATELPTQTTEENTFPPKTTDSPTPYIPTKPFIQPTNYNPTNPPTPYNPTVPHTPVINPTEPTESPESSDSHDFDYTIDINGNATITGYTGSAADVIVPEAINGYPVVAIGVAAFSDKENIKSVTIPDTVTGIGSNAFSNCSSLALVTVGTGIRTIGDNAFSDCSSLSAILYNGSKSQWNGVYLGSGNDSISNASIIISDTSDAESVIPKSSKSDKPRSINVKASSKTLYVKQSFTLNAKASDGSALNYSSSNSKVAAVSKNGTITAKKKGSAYIKITSGDIARSVKISVINPKLNKTKKTLKKGKTFSIKIKGLVGKAKFKSSKKSVAKVSKKGKVKALRKGKATITVTANGVKLKLKITVK